MTDEPQAEHWTLDKKVPLAIIFALVVQGAGLAYWAATLESRVNSAEKVISKLEGREGETREARERLIRLEERMISIGDDLRRVTQKLETLLEDRRGARP
ncbi:hypothetical protein V5F38_04180 [Xanthobacter sp. V0B-10]|uniref:hypothetical protein n=1 Tax=Xanthobacter albus TaxID=3119929 RepID=UPI0037278410